jgi:hypothetical protein
MGQPIKCLKNLRVLRGVMMFGFFKKEKTPKSNGPKFDGKLIRKFEEDHKKLTRRVEQIAHLIKINQHAEAKHQLKMLKTELLGHFMEEDIKLYWYLKNYYKESPEILDTVKNFEESIKKIQKEVSSFLDYYAQENTPLDKKFQSEFANIVDALSTRMQTEESNLYTLYHN